MKRKPIKMEVPILNSQYSVYIVISDAKYIVRYINKYYGDSYTENDIRKENIALTFYNPKYHPVIWIESGCKNIYSVLAHEATHAVNHIWEYIKEEVKDEVYAGSVEAIVRAVESDKRIKLTRG